MPRATRPQTAEEKALGLAPDEFLDPNGYIRVRDHTRVGGSILKHRLVMEQHLKRPLRKDEQVRFKTRNKHDISLGNLRLVSTEYSRSDIYRKIRKAREKIADLEQEILDLQAFLAGMDETESPDSPNGQVDAGD